MRPGWALGASLALCLALSGTARAYCLYKVSAPKPFVKWESQPVTYHVSSNLSDQAYLTAIDKAFKAWEAVTCSKLKFTKGTSFSLCTTAACSEFFSPPGKAIYVFWFKDKSKPSDLFKNTSDPKLPYVYNSFLMHNNAGGIVGASIAVNGYDFGWSTSGASGFIDVQNEMTFLVGAVIGLTESAVAGASMTKKITYGDTSKQTLAQDDKDGLIYMYKETGCPDPPAPNSSTGCSTGTATGDGTVTKDGPVSNLDGSTAGSEGSVPGKDSGGTGKQCTSTNQCPLGDVCTVEGYCMKAQGDDDGCNCSLGAAGGGAGPALLLALLGLALARRRWRSARRP